DAALDLRRRQFQREYEIESGVARGLGVRIFEKLEIGRKHANNCRRNSVQDNDLAEDARGTAEPPLPESVTDQRDGRYISNLVFSLREGAPDLRLDSQNTEQRRRET